LIICGVFFSKSDNFILSKALALFANFHFPKYANFVDKCAQSGGAVSKRSETSKQKTAKLSRQRNQSKLKNQRHQLMLSDADSRNGCTATREATREVTQEMINNV